MFSGNDTIEDFEYYNLVPRSSAEIRARQLDSIPESQNTTVTIAPVQQNPVAAPPIPIIDNSKTYILGQIGRNSTRRHNETLHAGLAPKRRRAVQEDERGQLEHGFTRYIPLHKRQVEGPIQCGPGNGCADGSCCNTDGRCGFKDAHCGATCISDCDATAMCGIDSSGGDKICALNLCCSYYGWCGVCSAEDPLSLPLLRNPE